MHDICVKIKHRSSYLQKQEYNYRNMNAPVVTRISLQNSKQ